MSDPRVPSHDDDEIEQGSGYSMPPAHPAGPGPDEDDDDGVGQGIGYSAPATDTDEPD